MHCACKFGESNLAQENNIERVRSSPIRLHLRLDLHQYPRILIRLDLRLDFTNIITVRLELHQYPHIHSWTQTYTQKTEIMDLPHQIYQI